MKLRLKGRPVKDVAELLRRHPSIQSSRAVKNELHLRARKIEREIEKSYSVALSDMAEILTSVSRLPHGVGTRGTKRVTILPIGGISKQVVTPSYPRLSPDYVSYKRKDSKEVFWRNTGAFGRKVASRLKGSSKDWKLRRVALRGKLGNSYGIRLTADIRQPLFHSRVMNNLVRDAFFNGDYTLPEMSYKRKNNPSINDQLAYLEMHRPLVSVVMRKHGELAFNKLKTKVFAGKL